MTVAVCVPSIPSRPGLLARALTSIAAQTRPPDAIHVTVDHQHQGAAATRNRAWQAASTDFVAFLDDDDELGPRHLELLLACQEDTGADLIYPWFTVVGGRDPLGMFGQPFQPDLLRTANWIPVTVLVRRSLLADVGGFPEPNSPEWPHDDCEDWGCWQRLLKAGCRFHHLPERTWLWHHHGANTSGKGDRW